MHNLEQVKKILKEEISTSSVDIIIVNKLEYYRSDFFKRNFKIKKLKDKISYIKYPFIYSGLYSEEYNLIIIFINNCKTTLSTNIFPKFTIYDIINTLRILYHEIKHLNQANERYNKSLTTIGFIYEMEDILINYNPKYYNLMHDQFFIEIEANVYATNKLKEFLSKNNMNDKEILSFVEKLHNKYKKKLYQYDFNQQFDEFIKCCNKYRLYNKNNKIIQMIYNEECNFKSLNELILDDSFNKLDIRIKTLLVRNLIKKDYLSIDDCQKVNILKRC